jgi:MOSC domain-containing protein YiiM
VDDPCGVCRFDGKSYTQTDLDRSIASVGVRRRWVLDGAPASVLTHPRVEAHVAVIDHPPPGKLSETAHALLHELFLLGRSVHELGAGSPTQTGVVVGLFASGGGVPKLPIDEAVIGYRGVAGDRQRTRNHHGRVWQALCLWSADVIDRLHAEGHPIAPGRAGENITIAGLDWSTLRPGTCVSLGDSVIAELSAYAAPCKKNAEWFVGGDFERMGHERDPGVSRIYASVLRDGVVRLGDPVVVEP